MYVVVVFYDVKPERLGSFSRALLHVARDSLSDEAGCKRFDVSIDPDDGSSFLAYEVYEDEAAWKRHQDSQKAVEFLYQSKDWLKHKHMLSYELLSGPGQS